MARLTTSAPARALGTNDFRVLVGLFTVSGAAGLVDQVCFSKYLTYVVGATAHAVSAVLAAFMTGLMVGATVGAGSPSKCDARSSLTVSPRSSSA